MDVFDQNFSTKQYTTLLIDWIVKWNKSDTDKNSDLFDMWESTKRPTHRNILKGWLPKIKEWQKRFFIG